MTIQAPFGRLATAMITPFKKDLTIDWDGVSTLAKHLVSTGHDAIVVSGTTGEAPTTSDEETDQIIKVVLEIMRLPIRSSKHCAPKKPGLTVFWL
jgi:4-hydroxy-tetrahydrodipicolinate synthase